MDFGIVDGLSVYRRFPLSGWPQTWSNYHFSRHIQLSMTIIIKSLVLMVKSTWFNMFLTSTYTNHVLT